jgi:hypothetical protein
MINNSVIKEFMHTNKYNILLILSIIFNALVLSNILQSDYFGDDLYNFQVPGLIPSDYPSTFDFASRNIIGWMGHGRFFPGTVYSFFVFDIFNTVFLYKLLQLNVVLLSVSLFAYLIYILSKNRYLALLLLFLTPLFFQYRYYHDPILSFHGLLPLLFIYITLSLIFLAKYLQGTAKYHYYLSLFFFMLSLVTYEISYVFILFYLPIILSQMKFRENIRKIILLLTPYFILLISLSLFTIYLRYNTAINTGPYLPNWDLFSIFTTYFNQTIAVIPLTYFLMFGNINFSVKYEFTKYVSILFLFGLIYWHSFALRKNIVFNKNLVFFAVLLLLLPGMLISLSPKFQSSGIDQNQVKFGLAYLPIYFQSFGASLLLSLFLIRLSSIKYYIGAGFLLGIVLTVHLMSNDEVVAKVNKPYKSSREVLSLFFTGKFRQDLENNSTIQFAMDSPLHRKEFLNMATKKNLNVVIAPDNHYDYKIWYAINNDFAIVNTEKLSGGASNSVIFRYDGTWREVYDGNDNVISDLRMPPFFNNFYEWEGDVGLFRWAGNSSSIFWLNGENKPKEEKISFEMGSLIPRSMIIKLNGKVIDNFAIVPGVQGTHTYTLGLISGRNIIEFLTAEPSVQPNSTDTRDLTFSLSNFKVVNYVQ